MANLTTTISQNTIIKATLAANRKIDVTRYNMITGTSKIGDIGNVTELERSDGSVLQFNSDTGDYESRSNLQNNALIINGGHF